MVKGLETISHGTPWGKKALEGCWLVTGSRYAVIHRILIKKVQLYGVHIFTVEREPAAQNRVDIYIECGQMNHS